MGALTDETTPRRRELLSGLDIDFSVEIDKDEKEAYSANMPHDEVPEFLARHKSESFYRQLSINEALITADTLVFCPMCNGTGSIADCEILGKPSDRREAVDMLCRLSGITHYVTTGVAIRTINDIRSFSVTSEVTFKSLTKDEISYYIDNYMPFDKAGAYGIQEWIGYIGITSIKGSYYNIMGLPVQRLYGELCDMLR